jgi:hypothetical protein
MGIGQLASRDLQPAPVLLFSLKKNQQRASDDLAEASNNGCMLDSCKPLNPEPQTPSKHRPAHTCCPDAAHPHRTRPFEPVLRALHSCTGPAI